MDKGELLVQKRSIVVAGGGIAGIACALRLRQFGLDPLVIEKEHEIRPMPKGEFFQPQGVLALRTLGILDSFSSDRASRIRQVSHHFKDPLLGRDQTFSLTYPDYQGVDFGLAVLHEDILELMRDRYEAANGRMRTGVSVEALNRGSDLSWNIALSGGEKITADIFLGADGRFSVTRKMAGLSTIELPCDRLMMVGLVEGLALEYGEFYTEEIPGGVLYAFKYPNGSSRAYICFRKSEFSNANKNRSEFFLNRLKESRLIGTRCVALLDQPAIMPSQDRFLRFSARGTALWLGDANGAVDPLGGHGMSLALEDALRTAEAIRVTETRPLLEVAKKFREVARESRQDYLHARFLAIWIALLFTGSFGDTHSEFLKKSSRWSKWLALKRYEKDAHLRRYLVDLFSGMNRDLFALYDLPYILGLLPTPLKSSLNRLESKFGRLSKWLRKPQNTLLTASFFLSRPEYLGVAAEDTFR